MRARRHYTPSYEMYPGRTWGDDTAYVYRSDRWAPVARWYELLEHLGYQPTPYETEQLTALRQALPAPSDSWMEVAL